MANYQILKADIDEKIYENAQQKITGENLNSILNAMVTTLGAGYQFAGVATIDTNPETSDAKVFYIANGKGIYTYFGGVEVTEDDVVVLYYDTAWHKVATGIASHEKLTELESKSDQQSNQLQDILEVGRYSRELISFTNTGHFIKTDGALGESDNWMQSNILHLQKYDKIIITCSGTSSFNTCIALTNAEGSSYTPVVFSTKTQEKHAYLATEECYVVVQYYMITGDSYIISDSKRLIENETILSEVKNNVNSIVGITRSGVNKKMTNLISKHVYAIAFDKTISYTGSASNYKVIIRNLYNGIKTDITTIYKTYPIYENLIFFKIPDNSDYITLNILNDSPDEIKFSIVDITEILKVASKSKTLMFEFGALYNTSDWEVDSEDTTQVRLRRYASIHLCVGDKVGLSNYTNARFKLVREKWNTGWRDADFMIEVEGDYSIVLATPDFSKQTSPDTLSSLVRITTKDVVEIDTLSKRVDRINKTLEREDSEHRTITFTNTGHFIKTDGTLGESDNWTQSNVIRLYKNEIIQLLCSGTGSAGVIISLTDEKQTFYTPVVFVISGQTQTLHKYRATQDCYVILQYYQKTGEVEIYKDSERLINIEGRLSDVETGIAEIVLPSYVEREQERVYRQLVNRTNTNSIVIAFNTDQHISIDYFGQNNSYNPKWAIHGLKSLANIAKKLPIDFIVLGGDIPGYGGGADNTICGILDEINVLNTNINGLDTPFISIPGNHDAFQNNGNITAQGMYNVHFKRSKGIKYSFHSGVDNCDCYFDDADNKIRYIIVDVYSRNVRTESYTTFLSNALSTMNSEYKAIIFSHCALTNEFNGVIKRYDSLSDTQGKDAFCDPIDQHEILNTYADNIIACICGHAHTDAWGVSDRGILYIETTSAVHTRLIFKDNNLVIPYAGVLNSAKECAYDFFVIDMVNQTIEAIRYGQGSNRKWYYKGSSIGLIGYTNCVYGIASVANTTLVFTNQSTSETTSVACDGNGYYEVYLALGSTYTISCNGYMPDTTQVTVNENTELNLELSIL